LKNPPAVKADFCLVGVETYLQISAVLELPSEQNILGSYICKSNTKKWGDPPKFAGRSAKVSVLPSASATVRKLKRARAAISIAPFQNHADKRGINSFYIDAAWECSGKPNL